MKCTVIEINTRTNKINTIKCKTKKEAKKYIENRKQEMNEKDKKIYQFGINNWWEDEYEEDEEE